MNQSMLNRSRIFPAISLPAALVSPCKLFRGVLAGAWVAVLVASSLLPAAASAQNQKTVVYLLRHAEDATQLIETAPRTFVQNCTGNCCVDVLNPLGQERAFRLGELFEQRRIAETLTHVLASHKIRTVQTVFYIAQKAGLGGDADQNPGDGVLQVPSTPAECAPGFGSSTSARAPMIEAVRALPFGSRAVVANHSNNIYPIMQAFGIDTSDPVKFPKNSSGFVQGFNNLWIIEIDAGGHGELREHVVLDFALNPSASQREGGHSYGWGRDQ